MAEETPIVGTIGLKIWIASGFDISTATLIQLRYVKPDGIAGNFTGIYEADEDGAHGAYYTTVNVTDIDVAGAWAFSLYIESGPNRFYGTTVKTEKFKEQMAT